MKIDLTNLFCMVSRAGLEPATTALKVPLRYSPPFPPLVPAEFREIQGSFLFSSASPLSGTLLGAAKSLMRDREKSDLAKVFRG